MTRDPAQDSSEFEAIEQLLRSVRPSTVGDVERTFYEAGWAAAVHLQTSSGLAATRSGYRWPTFVAGIAAGVAVAMVMLNIGVGWKSVRPDDDPFGPATMAQRTGPNVPQHFQSDLDDEPVSGVNVDSQSINDRLHSADVARTGESALVVAGTLYKRTPWLPGIPDWLWNREDVSKPFNQHESAGNSVLAVRGALLDAFTLNEWLEFPQRTTRTGLAQPVNDGSPKKGTRVLNARPLNLEMLQEWL